MTDGNDTIPDLDLASAVARLNPASDDFHPDIKDASLAVQVEYWSQRVDVLTPASPVSEASLSSKGYPLRQAKRELARAQEAQAAAAALVAQE